VWDVSRQGNSSHLPLSCFFFIVIININVNIDIVLTTKHSSRLFGEQPPVAVSGTCERELRLIHHLQNGLKMVLHCHHYRYSRFLLLFRVIVGWMKLLGTSDLLTTTTTTTTTPRLKEETCATAPLPCLLYPL
jgi:hypothetical protein